VITDDMNYSFASALSIQTTTVKDGANLTFQWGEVTRDFLGRRVDPVQDIDMVVVSLWGMSDAELMSALRQDALQLSRNEGALTFFPEEAGAPPPTQAQLLDFNSFHNDVPEEEVWARFDTSTPDYQYPPETNTFMMTVETGTTVGRDVRMIGLFKLDPTSTNTTVALTNTSTTMQYSISLAGVPQLAVPAATPTLSIDWSRMTVNALGNAFDVAQITEIVVAHYADYAPLDLEERFLFLRDEATAWYSGEAQSGTVMDLSGLEDSAGNVFPGIDSTGVWLVALFCTSGYTNPAPWSITLLRPCE